MNRRRFLTIMAAAMAAPSASRAETVWSGTAFGADCRIALTGPRDKADRALAELPALIARIDGLFSLHNPASALSRLNRTGRLDPVPMAFARLMDLSGRLHRLTGGAFDPTVQALWGAAAGEPAGPVGWARVRQEDGQGIRLSPGMALTFNGLAQGYAADAVRALLSAHGFERGLVDMGEYAALGGPYRLGIADPSAGLVAERRIEGTALSVSSPFATLVGGVPHIRHPRGLPPLWSTVAVEASTAVVADGLSTAFVFLPAEDISAIRREFGGLGTVTLIGGSGDVSTV